ncbi:MAG TPA: monooxygenase [Rugosimonospora sp.]
MWRMAVDPRRVRRQAGVRFVKLLGTGRDGRFGPASADPTRWAALTVYDRTRPRFPGWDRRAVASCRIDLAPLAVRGSWAGRQPFATGSVDGTTEADGTTGTDGTAEAAGTVAHGTTGPERTERTEGTERPVLALTRARLRLTRAAAFWRAIGPVAAAASEASGLLAAFGIGEAPIGWQGTITVWRRPTDLFSFAYRHPQHRQAIEWTTTTGWYAEEMFARFAVLNVVGDSGVIGWGAERHAAGRPSADRQRTGGETSPNPPR